MKQITVCIFAIFISGINTLYGQVQLHGQLRALGNSSVIIEYYDGDTPKTETIKVADGQFIWNGPIKEAQKITLIFPGKATWIFVEPGKLTVKGSRDSLAALTVTGSKTNDDALEHAALLKPLVKEENALLALYGKLDENKQAELEEQLAAIGEKKHVLSLQFIAAHSKSAFSLNLATEQSRLGTYEETYRMVKLLDKNLRITAEGKRLSERMDVLKRSAIGAIALNFVQPDSNGRSVDLSLYRGKYVFVDFWASWCYPCRAEIPNIIKAYHQFKDRNLEIISISLDDRKDSWLKAMRTLQMPWKQLCDLTGWKNELCVYYGLKGIPSSLLLDPQGRIVAKDLRGIALIKKLDQLLM